MTALSKQETSLILYAGYHHVHRLLTSKHKLLRRLGLLEKTKMVVNQARYLDDRPLLPN